MCIRDRELSETPCESELRDTGLPVFHKKLEQNQKEAPVQIAGPLLPLQFTALCTGKTKEDCCVLSI